MKMKGATLLHLLMDLSVHNRDPPEARDIPVSVYISQCSHCSLLCVSCCVYEATGSYQRCQ